VQDGARCRMGVRGGEDDTRERTTHAESGVLTEHYRFEDDVLVGLLGSHHRKLGQPLPQTGWEKYIGLPQSVHGIPDTASHGITLAHTALAIYILSIREAQLSSPSPPPPLRCSVSPANRASSSHRFPVPV
jgi:hypothetical protein